MKRDLTPFESPDVKEELRKWYEQGGDTHACPFPGTHKEPLDRCYICYGVFPNLRGMKKFWKGVIPCPCDAYSKQYVMKIAREVLR